MIELYKLILEEKEHNQRTWFNSGVGTYVWPSWKSPNFYVQVIAHKIDLAIAWCVDSSLFDIHSQFTSCSFRNFEKIVLDAYRWLSDNYQPGDCIYMFGAL
jgi:uncharacterized protein (DUF2235 family)